MAAKAKKPRPGKPTNVVRIDAANYQRVKLHADAIGQSATRFVDSVLEDAFEAIETGQPKLPRVALMRRAIDQDNR